MNIGLFFGSFNPIHCGHLAIATHMVQFTDLDKVWFVVSPHNPLKNKDILLIVEHRLEMVKLAIANHSQFEVCDVELSLPQPSYTIDTLQHLQNKYHNNSWAIIMGSDGLVDFEKWKNYRELIANYHRYVYPRPNTPENILRNLENGTFVNAPILDISSTQIRDAIRAKKNAELLVPDIVLKYILENNLYSEI